MQALHGYPVQGCVVQDHHGIRIQSQALEREQGVVGLHHHIAGLGLIGEHTASMHTGACASWWPWQPSIEMHCLGLMGIVPLMLHGRHRVNE